MSNLFISIVLLYFIDFAEPTEARFQITRTTKNPNELIALDVLESYHSEIDRIESGIDRNKSFGKIIQEINDRSIKETHCDLSGNKKCAFDEISIHSMIDLIVLTLRGATREKIRNENKTPTTKDIMLDLLDGGTGKLQEIKNELQHYASHFNKKAEQLIKLYIRYHNSSNKINDRLESRFEQVQADIDGVEAMIATEINITYDLISKIRATRTYIKGSTSEFDLNRSFNELDAACEKYLQGHCIKLPQNLDERVTEFAKKIKSEVVENHSKHSPTKTARKLAGFVCEKLSSLLPTEINCFKDNLKN